MHPRIVHRNRHRVDDARVLDAACLAPEPALPLHVLHQQVDKGLGDIAAEQVFPPARCGIEHRGLGGDSCLRRLLDPGRLQLEPEEGMTGQRQRVWFAADRREGHTSEQLDGLAVLELGQVQADLLREPGQVGHYQDVFVLMSRDEREDVVVLRSQDLDDPATERLVPFANGDQPSHPPEQ